MGMNYRKYRQLLSYFTITLVALYLFSCNVQSPKEEDKVLFEKTIIWDAGENNVDGYRIPGIVVAKDGSALAFTEERPDYGDEEPKSLVVKRSEDKGVTWSESIYIERGDGSFWANHQELIHPEDDADKKEVWTNIAPIVDRETGRIFFFYSLSEGAIAGQNLQRYTRVFYRYSDDNGLTWSDRNEVTQILNAKEDGSPNKDEDGNWITDENGFPADYLGRAFHMPGPGHGIQLSSGRLLLQVWNRKALGVLGEGTIPVDERKYGISTMYSDDHGETWHFGAAFGENLNVNESRMAELENGDVYINARYVPTEPGVRNNHRVTAISHDGGIHWENVKVDKNFPISNHCDGGLVSLNGSSENQGLLLYSKNESTEGRENLVVRLSKDDGESWPVSKVVDEGEAWYSDMAVLPDNTILLIYETGKDSPVYCVRFNIDWLTHNNESGQL